MCGIIGVFGAENSKKKVSVGLEMLKYRGQDGSKVVELGSGTVGHCLHSIVSRVEQPLVEKDSKGAVSSALISNCEIYNWKELNEKYSLNARNDAEVLFKLLIKKNIKALDELDGVYAFAFLKGTTLVIARDLIGVKPVWYGRVDGFAFASEKKALEKIGAVEIEELNPRKIIIFDTVTRTLGEIDRDFFKIVPQLKKKEEEIVDELQPLLESAVKKRIPERKFGVLFSGGIDSTTIALLLKKFGQKFICYTVVLDDPALRVPEDLISSQNVAEALGLDLKVIKLKLSDIEKQVPLVVPLIEDSNVVKVEVALTFFAACVAARKDGCKVLFSGLGSEEIFAGYQRHKEVNGMDINRECVSGLLKMYERDLYRDDVITMFNSIELRLPFLDKKLVEYALKIPGELKIKDGKNGEMIEKYVLRQVAKNIGLKDEFAMRPKKAAQYGSNMSKAVEKLAKKNGFKHKSEYLKTFYDFGNVKLAAMISSGKDGMLAAYRMAKQNYSLSCFITIKSSNPDSFMFHTPNISMAEMQAESCGIPIIVQSTTGEKEKELEDLEKALVSAKKKYGVQGIVTGALYSNYQRERIEKICEKLGLKVFSPLWHIDQEKELQELLYEGFSVMISSVAADGLDKSWLGKILTTEDIDKLIKLSKKFGINPAGEGGEYESLVIDCPLFKKKIVITDFEIIEEAEHTARFVIKKAELVGK